MPFSDPLTADTVLVRAAIQSPDYVPGVSGWIIRIDGTAEFSELTARGDLTAAALKTGTTVPPQRRIDINSDPSFAGSPRNTIFFLQDTDDDSHKGVDATEIQASGASTRWLSLLSGGTYDSGVVYNSHETIPLNANIDMGSSGHIFMQPGQDDAGGRAYLYDNPTALYWPLMSEAHFQILGPAVATAALTLTTVVTDITGATITFTTKYTNAMFIAFAQFDFTTTTAIGAGGVNVGEFAVDGTTITKCFAIGDANSVNRQGASAVYADTLAAAGSHTIKLQARKTINAGASSVGVTQTALTILLIEFP